MSRDFDVVIVGAGVDRHGHGQLCLLARKLASPGPGRDRRRAPSRHLAAPRAGGARDWDLRVFALSRASQRLLQLCGRMATPAAAASLRLRAHVRLGCERRAAGRGLAHVRLRRDRRAESRLHRRRPRIATRLPAAAAAAGAVLIEASRAIGRRERCRCAYRLDRWARARRAELLIARRRHRIEDPRTARHRYRRARLPPGRAGRPRAHREAAPEHGLAAILGHGTARLPAAARWPLIDRVERRTRRGARVCARSTRRRLPPRSMRRAAAVLGELELTTPVASFPLKLQYAVDYVAAARGAAGRRRACGASAGGAGTQFGTARLRLARRCARASARRRAICSAIAGCCAATSAGAKARICSPPPALDGLERLFSSANPARRAAARSAASARSANCLSSSDELAQRALGWPATCRLSQDRE